MIRAISAHDLRVALGGTQGLGWESGFRVPGFVSCLFFFFFGGGGGGGFGASTGLGFQSAASSGEPWDGGLQAGGSKLGSCSGIEGLEATL